MITLFTIPRAFTGTHAIRQRNALSAWTHLTPRPEIILFCDDPGVREAASEFDCIHVPDIECNDDGIPYVSDAFRIANRLASHDILCYANADILFTQSLLDGAALASAHFLGHFAVVGQRWDITLNTALNLTGDWQKHLVAQARQENRLRKGSALDYFLYRKNTVEAVDMPKFLVGSPGWDNWLAGEVILRGMPLIDGTDTIWCIHQAHEHLWPDDGTRYNRILQWEHGGVTGYTSSGEWALQDGQVRKVSPRMRVKEIRYVTSAKTRVPTKATRRKRVSTGVSLNRQELRSQLIAAQMVEREAELERREQRGVRRAARDSKRRRKSQTAAAAKPPLRRVRSSKKFERRRNADTVGSPDLENRVPRRTRESGFRRQPRRQLQGITDVEAARDE